MIAGKYKTLIIINCIFLGCDKGLGYATAKSLDKHGYSVIAGCYNVKGENVQRLQKETSSKLQAVQLDVTKTEDLESVRQWMNSNLDGGKTAYIIVVS